MKINIDCIKQKHKHGRDAKFSGWGDVTADRDSNVNPLVTQVAKPLIMQNFKV